MAENCTSLVLDRDIKVVIDSELYKSKQCSCTPHPCGSSSAQCDCREYCELIWVQFSSHDGCKTDPPCVTREKVVQQCKRGAEMAVVDWLVYYRDLWQAGDSVVCFVTPGDIDAICIHLFALSWHWKRKENAKFKNNVYVELQKPYGKSGIYNITALLELL
ncbi:hypothetical protein DPMN_155764 [Dreissena polymorpha]|uniref:Uncharacterized protein n=1 Tax=Dreissena polymorpha TaxID=45954 RepID=A0A9D4FT61_DREPO|nr:hypothetical protein DPMN_155764 [Dreissena polymorpha]